MVAMTTWHDLVADAPDLAARARAVLTSSTNAVLGTVRADGSVLETYVAGIRSEYDGIRDAFYDREDTADRYPIDEARAHPAPVSWDGYRPSTPHQLGIGVTTVPLTELLDRIDWTPFFQAWELSGTYPKILSDPIVGESARSLYEDAQEMLHRIVEEQWLTARAVTGLWPANSVGDDIEIYTDDTRSEVLATVHTLRQQTSRARGRAENYALADFVAPKDSGIPDYLGGFVVTAGVGEAERVAAYEAEHDDYRAIMLKALADRFAEALAEYVHERVRKQSWGYAGDEALDNDALIAEQYQGIRPAPGYPACPDHTEKRTLFDLLAAEENVGVELTESFAMTPASSVSGWYFAHPQARYFGVGRILKDQVEDYARRKGMTVAEVERWLAPNLGYVPGR